jgi:tRNA(Ile)-lysidine synthase
MSFTPERLLQTLQRHPPPPRYWLAFSGGLDSSALLHALHGLGDRLEAPLSVVHVDHGLQPQAGEWAEHCRRSCAALGLPLEVRSVEVDLDRGEGPEAAARRAREQAFAGILRSGERLLTAHHRDDQAETLLLQLLRGAGVRGLAGMPDRRELGAGWLERPLLAFRRAQLQAYVEAHGVRWIDDPTNQGIEFDRNYIRHSVMPVLERRWPAAARTLSRSARHCAGAAKAVDALAGEDLRQCRTQAAQRLEIAPLLRLSTPRRAEVLRLWIRQQAFPIPDQDRIDRVLSEVADARPDASPHVSWSDAEVRRFRGQLWLLPPLPPHDPGQVIPWPDPRRLALPGMLGELHLLERPPHPWTDWFRQGRVTVRFRLAGHRCRNAPPAGSRSLKKVLQENAVPPWLRDRVPLVFVDQELLAIADYRVCYTPRSDDESGSIVWSLGAPWR